MTKRRRTTKYEEFWDAFNSVTPEERWKSYYRALKSGVVNDVSAADHYKFSKQQIARHVCIDCGVNVIEKGDYTMIDPKIWREQFGLKDKDNLCIDCIEKRLGREIRMGDIISTPSVEGYPQSKTLQARIFPPGSGSKKTKATRKRSR